jgi:hypothetical protein
MDQTLAGILGKQFDAAWDMLDEAVHAIDGKGWQTGTPDHLVPARLAYHVLETADYYVHPDLSAFEWSGRFGVDWETAEAGELPDQSAIGAYLHDVRLKVAAWLDAQDDSGLLAPDAVFHDEGMTHLDRALYVLRHTHQHIGELFAVLRERGIPRPGWR